MSEKFTGPLAGLNVIDFGHYFAGPMAAMLLSDQGANVVHIQRPGEPELPSQQYRLLNRNKKVLELDLKTEFGKSQALALIEKADVLIENFRPGVMNRLGLDYARLKSINPGLVYLSLPGFASTDKERAHIQAWEGVLNAATGLYHDLSFVRKHLGFPPVYSWVPLSSVYGATTGIIAVLAALVAREEQAREEQTRDGQGMGTLIETPLAEAGQEGFGVDYFAVRTMRGMKIRPDSTETVREEFEGWPEGSAYRFDPNDPPQVQEQKALDAERFMKSTPFYTIFPCKDGRKILIFNILYHRMDGLFKALGIHQQLLKEGFVHGGPWNLALDNNLDITGLGPERSQRLKALMSERFLTKTAEEWETIVSPLIPSCMVRSREEWMALQPMLDSGVFTKMDNGQSEITVAGRFADVSGPHNAVTDACYQEPQAIGTEQALSFFSDSFLSENDRKQSGANDSPSDLKKGNLLKGLKVLDLSNGLAGPTSAFTLAQYGAEVICVNSLAQQIPFLLNILLEVTQSKRSILLDTKNVLGQDDLKRLIGWADVVVHNILDDTAVKMGITHKQLQSINPNVISCQVSCLGGPKRGYWEMRPGFDPIAQMISGLQERYGTLDKPKEHGSTLTTDNLGGFGLALSALLALYQKKKTGFAGEGRCSLARVCNYIQLPYMIAENGNCDWGEAHGQLAVGDHWWQRMYACAPENGSSQTAPENWIYVGTREEEASRLAIVVTNNAQAGATELQEAFLTQPSSYWLEKLNMAGIACHQVMSVNDIIDRAQIRRVSNEEADEYAEGAGEILRWEDHPCGLPIMTRAPSWVRVGENFSYKRLAPAPYPGQNGREVLRELGYSEDSIDELVRLKVVSEYIPEVGEGCYFIEGLH